MMISHQLFGCDLQAGSSEQSNVEASTHDVLEVGAGPASSSLTATPHISAYAYAYTRLL